MCTAKETDLDKPVKFSTSKASTWKAEYSRKGAQTEEELWYELPVILGSVSAFLIYFLVLREENDIDETLKVSLDGIVRQLAGRIRTCHLLLSWQTP